MCVCVCVCVCVYYMYICVCIYVYTYIQANIVNHTKYIAIYLLCLCPDNTRAGDEQTDGAAPAPQLYIYIYMRLCPDSLFFFGRR